jgi:hypothetical protein
MNRILAAAIRLTLLLLPTILGLAQQPRVTIGMVVDGPGRRPGQSTELIEQEIASLLDGQYTVRFPEEKRLDGAWAASRVRSALDQLLADPEVDVVIAVGALSSLEAGGRGPLPKPVLATAILFPEIFDIPYQERSRRVFGLGFATLLTLGVVPVLYSLMFRVSFKHFNYSERTA